MLLSLITVIVLTSYKRAYGEFAACVQMSGGLEELTEGSAPHDQTMLSAATGNWRWSRRMERGGFRTIDRSLRRLARAKNRVQSIRNVDADRHLS